MPETCSKSTCNHLTCILDNSTCLKAFLYLYTSQFLLCTTSKSFIRLSGTGAESHARPSPNCAGSQGQATSRPQLLQASVQLPAPAVPVLVHVHPIQLMHLITPTELQRLGIVLPLLKKNALDLSFVGKGLSLGLGVSTERLRSLLTAATVTRFAYKYFSRPSCSLCIVL
jgi:hypothetical protein